MVIWRSALIVATLVTATATLLGLPPPIACNLSASVAIPSLGLFAITLVVAVRKNGPFAILHAYAVAVGLGVIVSRLCGTLNVALWLSLLPLAGLLARNGLHLAIFITAAGAFFGQVFGPYATLFASIMAATDVFIVKRVVNLVGDFSDKVSVRLPEIDLGFGDFAVYGALASQLVGYGLYGVISAFVSTALGIIATELLFLRRLGYGPALPMPVAFLLLSKIVYFFHVHVVGSKKGHRNSRCGCCSSHRRHNVSTAELL